MASHFRRGAGSQRTRVIVISAFALLLVAFGIVKATPDNKSLVVGKYDGPNNTTPTVTVPPPDIGRKPLPTPRNSSALLGANGRAYGKALAFNSSIPIKDGLVFVLIAGSDARPGQNLHKTRTDSLHVVAIDPATRSGTIVGIPRDTYVEIPGRGEAKINTAMGSGGPSLLMETVRNFTGLPVEYYVLTGFEGFSTMVDDLGGVDVYVPRNMNDKYSGAHFAEGYHHFNGEQALAFCRDRHTAYGDFTRSENHGRLMLATLAKLRSEVDDDSGLRRWLSVLARHAELDAPMSELEALAALSRRLDPSWLQNVVMPGRVGSAGSQSVVYPTEAAAAMWGDLRDDARLDTAPSGNGTGGDVEETPTTYPEDTTTSTEPTTTTTTRPPLLGGGGGSPTTDPYATTTTQYDYPPS
jgi:polyisoprenyl-teichoic acid--peptidoglycan teichoic acid transferase